MTSPTGCLLQRSSGIENGLRRTARIPFRTCFSVSDGCTSVGVSCQPRGHEDRRGASFRVPVSTGSIRRRRSVCPCSRSLTASRTVSSGRSRNVFPMLASQSTSNPATAIVCATARSAAFSTQGAGGRFQTNRRGSNPRKEKDREIPVWNCERKHAMTGTRLYRHRANFLRETNFDRKGGQEL